MIFVAAKMAAEIFVRLELPGIAGELLVGVLLGPHVAGVISVDQSAVTLADIGLVILLFTVGLETPLSELLSVGRSALMTSVTGIAIALVTGALVVAAFGGSLSASLLAGTALAASSVGVGARVFQDLGMISAPAARVVLGAAVVDDVIVLAIFPLVQGVRAGGTLDQQRPRRSGGRDRLHRAGDHVGNEAHAPPSDLARTSACAPLAVRSGPGLLSGDGRARRTGRARRSDRGVRRRNGPGRDARPLRAGPAHAAACSTSWSRSSSW